MSIKEVSFYVAECDRCGEKHDHYEFSAWSDHGQARDVAVDDGWFDRDRLVRLEPPSEEFPRGRGFYETVELVCPDCQTCDVCGSKDAWQEDGHLVCEDHEDHDFDAEGGRS
jgi:hypothetical protein